ncbi:PD-(D/E)XK nuclease domain-containing protein [Cylindrospermopsis raciborskii DSH]|uniref:PD-(D/E)XK nuclease domain-containing protein n=1 Tax=Cylindrospermopsis raciborskii TaxID=77022 RepID=UPI002ED8414E
MEIKVVEGNQVQGNPALDQILQRNYAEKYRGEPGKSVHEIGLIFSRSQRIVAANEILYKRTGTKS